MPDMKRRFFLTSVAQASAEARLRCVRPACTALRVAPLECGCLKCVLLVLLCSAVMAASPQPFRESNFATPFSDPGRLDTHDWFMLAGPIGKMALAGLGLRANVEKAVFDLLDVLNFLWQKSFHGNELEQLVLDVNRARVGIELYLPVSELDIKLHNLKHLAEKVALTGPLWCTAAFKWELMWGWYNRCATCLSLRALVACARPVW